MKRILILSFVLFLSACSTPAKPEMTRKQWLDLTSRTYTNVSKEKALSAAEKLFRLADKDDFKIVHTQAGLEATRNWIAYAVIVAATGTDSWRVQAKPVKGGVRVSMQVNTQGQSMGPGLTTARGVWTVDTSPMTGSPVAGTAIHDVFWARMDYLLGKRTDWMDCKKADARVKNKTTWGDNSPLCNSFNVDDLKP